MNKTRAWRFHLISLVAGTATSYSTFLTIAHFMLFVKCIAKESNLPMPPYQSGVFSSSPPMQAYNDMVFLKNNISEIFSFSEPPHSFEL